MARKAPEAIDHSRGVERVGIELLEGGLDDRVVRAPDDRHQEQQDVDARQTCSLVVPEEGDEEKDEEDEDADDTGGTYRGKAGHTTNQIFVVCPRRGRARSFCVAVLLPERVEEEQQQRFGFPSMVFESSRSLLPAGNSLT